jgi:hypothetical protein
VSIESDPGLFFPQLVMGIRDVNVFALYGERKNAGDISAPFFPSNGLELFVSAIGTDVVTGSAPSYTHTITPTNTLASLTIEKNLGGSQSLQFPGSKIGKYSLKLAASDTEAQFTASVISKSVNILTSPSAISVTNEMPFVFSEAQLTVFGNVVVQASNITIDIDNGLKPTYTFNNSRDLEFLTPVTRKISGQFDVVFDSLNDSAWGYFNLMNTEVQGALVIALTHPGTAGSLTITLPQINISKYADSVKLEDVIMTTLDFTASYDLAAGTPSSIGAAVVNAVSTAY